VTVTVGPGVLEESEDELSEVDGSELDVSPVLVVGATVAVLIGSQATVWASTEAAAAAWAASTAFWALITACWAAVSDVGG